MKSGFLFIAVLCALALCGCGQIAQPEYDLQRAEQQNAEYERQLKIGAEQFKRAEAMDDRQEKLMEAYEEDLERQRKLLAAYEEDVERQRTLFEKQDELLKKWELNLERFGRVLDQWEKTGATNPSAK